MTDSGLTREDMREALRDMQSSINRGFDGVHSRLDKLNSKTDTHAQIIAAHEERWKRLDNATRGSTSDAAGVGVKPPDWKLLASIGAVIGGMAYGLWQAVVKVSGALAGK